MPAKDEKRRRLTGAEQSAPGDESTAVLGLRKGAALTRLAERRGYWIRARVGDAFGSGGVLRVGVVARA